jgi:hypothetical protein
MFYGHTWSEEDVVSLEDSGSECFDTSEAGSSADEMEDCLSAVSEGVAVAEVTSPVPPEVINPLPTPLHRTPLTGGAP